MESTDAGLCIVRGSINHDEYFNVPHIARPGETLASTAYASRLGGKGANQAVAVHRAGGRVRFLGAVGTDASGQWVAGAGLQAATGVDDGRFEAVVLKAEEPTGRALIQVDEAGENSIILFPGANHSTLHEKSFAASALAGERAFPAAACVLLQNEIGMEPLHYALAHAGAADKDAQNGTIIVLNPSPLPTPAEMRALRWARVTWLIVNEDEARGVLAALEAGDAPPAPDYHDVVKRLGECAVLAATSVVCTLGARGVVASVLRGDGAGRETVHVPAAALTGDVRDTTGAGDCFAGYFVQGVMALRARGGKVDAAAVEGVLRVCVVAAGMCCEKQGTIDSIPMRAQVEARLVGK